MDADSGLGQLVIIFLLLCEIGLLVWLIRKENIKAYLSGASFLTVLVALFLLGPRITEFSLSHLGTIKAAASEANQYVKQIKDIRNEVDAEKATIDAVAKKATQANELSKETAEKNELATAQLQKIASTLAQASKELSDLQAVEKFNLSVVSAQAGDRRAFEQLKVWSKDPSFQFSDLAGEMYSSIEMVHFPSVFGPIPALPSWKPGADPSKLNLAQLRSIYSSMHSGAKVNLIRYISERKDISKHDKMQFLIDVIENDQGLTNIEWAEFYFNQEAGTNLGYLATKPYLDWWKENQSTIH